MYLQGLLLPVSPPSSLSVFPLLTLLPSPGLPSFPRYDVAKNSLNGVGGHSLTGAGLGDHGRKGIEVRGNSSEQFSSKWM